MATLGSSEPDVFVGGDLAGLSDITVEAVRQGSETVIGMVTVVEALQPLKLNMNNLPVVDMATLGSSEPDVFVGGDLAGLSDITVEAVRQ
ncbi:hypothetical protein J6590_099846 [Homalodisca vitripennis]|nr:hypothetical protein J6590_099846 [Homalodisca vitripennis]